MHDLTSGLSAELRVIQTKVIGLFKPYFANEYLPVIENREGCLTCISVGSLLGLQTLHIGIESGKFEPMPKKQRSPLDQYANLAELMENPFELNKWYNSITLK